MANKKSDKFYKKNNDIHKEYFDMIEKEKGRSYIRIDTKLLSLLFDSKYFTATEMKVFLWIYRNTIGWKDSYSARYNISRIHQETGICRNAIKKYIDKFVKDEWMYISTAEKSKYICMTGMGIYNTLNRIFDFRLKSEEEHRAKEEQLKKEIQLEEEEEAEWDRRILEENELHRLEKEHEYQEMLYEYGEV